MLSPVGATLNQAPGRESPASIRTGTGPTHCPQHNPLRHSCAAYLGSMNARARLKRDRIFARRVQVDGRQLAEKARFLWNSSLVECRMQMTLTQALILETHYIGSESQFSKWAECMRTRLSSIEHNSNRENMFVVGCL